MFGIERPMSSGLRNFSWSHLYQRVYRRVKDHWKTFRKQEADTKKELKKVRKQLREDIDSLQNRLKWANIAGMPALVIFGGLAAVILKRQRKK